MTHPFEAGRARIVVLFRKGFPCDTASACSTVGWSGLRSVAFGVRQAQRRLAVSINRERRPAAIAMSPLGRGYNSTRRVFAWAVRYDRGINETILGILVGAATTLVGAAVGAFAILITYWRAAPRLKLRAFLFCFTETSDWKLVVQARNLGRLPVSLNIYGIRQEGWRPNGKIHRQRTSFTPEFGPQFPFEIMPNASVQTWIADGTDLYEFGAYGEPHGGHQPCYVIIEGRKWRARRIRIGSSPRRWGFSEFRDAELGWKPKTSKTINLE